MTEYGRSGKEIQESKRRKMKRRRTIKDDLEVENDMKILDLKVKMVENSNEWRKRIHVEEPYSRSRSLRIKAPHCCKYMELQMMLSIKHQMKTTSILFQEEELVHLNIKTPLKLPSIRVGMLLCQKDIKNQDLAW